MFFSIRLQHGGVYLPKFIPALSNETVSEQFRSFSRFVLHFAPTLIAIMSRFAISQCTFEDAEAIGRVNVNSFWTDDNWVLLWRGKTKEYVASQSARRSAQNLSKDDTYRRHQKVVDLSTGRIVGYARWVLPETGLKNPECQWPSAKVPEYTKEQKIQAVREYSAADWEWDSSLDELDIKVNALKQQVTRGRIFISEQIVPDCAICCYT